MKYSNSKWKTSVDYLFVRNHLTNPKELVKVRIEMVVVVFVGRMIDLLIN